MKQGRVIAACAHDASEWHTAGVEHQLRCHRCRQVLERQFAYEAPPHAGRVLFKTSTGYHPFDPKGWLS